MPDMLALVNAERELNGKLPLQLDPCLTKAAQAHSDEQARANKMGHRMPGEADLLTRVKSVSPPDHWTSWAENIGCGSQSPDTMMRSWNNSTQHHTNILGHHTHFGAALAVSPQGKAYWTQIFANDGTVCVKDGRLVADHTHEQPLHQTTDRASIELMLVLVNRCRAEQHLRPLVIDACLIRAAQAHSDEQARVASMTHRVPGEPELMQRVLDATGDKQRWAGWGENVGFGTRSEEKIMDSWMESPKHRDNLMGEFTHFGAAMAMGVDDKPYWTQVFGNDGSYEDEPLDGELDVLPSEAPISMQQQLDMLRLVNEERVRVELRPLELDACLVASAQAHSAAQAQAGKMSHQLPEEEDLVTRVNAASPGRHWIGWAENVGFGSDDGHTVLQMWMNSPQHRGNILGQYTHFGVGVAHRRGKPYWTQVFGTLDATGGPTSGDTTITETIVRYSTAGGIRPERVGPQAMAAKLEAMLTSVNEARATEGLSPLQSDAGLARAAEAHCIEQACAGEMSHQLPGEPDLVERVEAAAPGRFWTGWAENVGFGSADEQMVMQMWLQSPKHRDNIFGPYSHFGAAMVNDADGKPYWTQVFGQLDEDPLAGNTAALAGHAGDVYVTVTTTAEGQIPRTRRKSIAVPMPAASHPRTEMRPPVTAATATTTTTTTTTKKTSANGSTPVHTVEETTVVIEDGGLSDDSQPERQKRRSRLSRTLKRFSLRVQKSFEADDKATPTDESSVLVSEPRSKSPTKNLFGSIFGSMSRSSKKQAAPSS